MTAYRTSLLLLSGMLLATTVAAQPRPSAPDPSAYAYADPNAHLDTRGDRHPHVERGRDGSLIFRNEHLVAELVRGSDGTYGRLNLYPATRPTQPWAEPMASVGEFAALAWGSGAGQTAGTFRARTAEIGKERDRVILRGESGAGSTSGSAEVTLWIGREPWLSWDVKVRATRAATLTQFRPMALTIGHAGRHTALFPGVEFSEVTENVGGYATPHPQTPDPLSVTVPLIGAAQEDTTVALMWNPRQDWGGAGFPAAQAAFADRPDAPAAATGVALSVPPPAGGQPGALALAAGRQVELGGKFLVLRETENIASAIRQWNEAYGGPTVDLFGQQRENRPHEPRDWSRQQQAARAVYNANRTNAAPTTVDPWEADLDRENEVYDALVQWLEAGPAHARPVSRTRGTSHVTLQTLEQSAMLDPRIAYRSGDVVRSLTSQREVVEELIRSQVARGNWPLGIPSDRPTLTEDLRILPEKPADVEVGTITQHVLPILRYAAYTGDSDAVGAGIRALEYIDRPAAGRPYGRFRIPAGAGVPFERRRIPTLYAAAQAAECFLLGYQVTGEPRYLDSARYWADTGLPFVYLWDDPARPALRGAAIPRFGPDAAGNPGEGRASQRAGLYYARVLQKLTQVRPDGFYDRVVRSLLASAQSQQPAGGANAGLLPEFWYVRESRAAGRWLTPGLVLAVQAALERRDLDVNHVRVRTGPDRLFVASGAEIDRPTTSSMRLRLNLRGASGQETYTTVTGVAARPIRVEYNSTSLPVIRIPVDRKYLREADQEFGPGWFYDDATGLLTIRVRHTSGDDHLEVRWPDPRTRTPIDRVDIRARNNR